MRLFRRPGAFVLRSLVRELRVIRDQLTIQNRALVRIADRIAPVLPETETATVRADTGLSFRDDADQYLLQEFAAKHYASTGHWPTDDEALSYLADEKTRDLHTRLVERDAEIARLAAEGR
jgi:hypothetical protein